MATPPRIRLHLTIVDVGPRGAEVMLTCDTGDGPRAFTGATLEDAIDQIKPVVRRLLWGADQPDAGR